MCLKLATECVANSADPDQMPHNVASDQGLHFCLDLSVPTLRVNKVTSIE